MGGKKAVEKSREWEKERRDKLNIGFRELSQLLPSHDPSVSLSKKEILIQAAAYITQLRHQNQQILNTASDTVLKVESERLRKRVGALLVRTRLLVEALRSAGLPIPPVHSRRANHLSANKGGEVVETKKVKCGCEPRKKKPLKEINPANTEMHKVTNTSLILPTTQVLSEVERGGGGVLGPGTLILADGRVLTVPSPAQQTTLILVPQQRANPPPQRQRRLQAKLAPPPQGQEGKAPIPSINTFRLEAERSSLAKRIARKGKTRRVDRAKTKLALHSAQKAKSLANSGAEPAQGKSVTSDKEELVGTKSSTSYTIESLFSKENHDEVGGERRVEGAEGVVQEEEKRADVDVRKEQEVEKARRSLEERKEEEARIREVEEAERRRREEEVRRRLVQEEEVRRRLQVEEEETKRRKAEEEKVRRKQAEEEVVRRKQAEEEAVRRKQAEEEAVRRKQAEEEAVRRKQVEEEAARRKQAEEEAVRRKQAEEEAVRRKQAEEEAVRRKQAEEEAVRRRLQAEEEEARKRQAEEVKKKQAEEQEARRRQAAEEEARRRREVEEEARRRREAEEVRRRKEGEAVRGREPDHDEVQIRQELEQINAHTNTQIGVEDGRTAGEKLYSTNTEGSSFKTDCVSELLRSANRELSHNIFMPIIDEVRLGGEGGSVGGEVWPGVGQPESISPTAAFLLAFPLVATSKPTDQAAAEHDHHHHHPSTPTTILQIGGMEGVGGSFPELGHHDYETPVEKRPQEYQASQQDFTMEWARRKPARINNWMTQGGGGGGGEVESSDSTLLCGLPSFEMFDGRGQHPLSLIPATLPTLVGDLALATTPPHHTKTAYQGKKSGIHQDGDGGPEKWDTKKYVGKTGGQSNASFLSVSQLVEAKSKKQGTRARQASRATQFSQHCMFNSGGEKNNFLPNLSWKETSRVGGGSYKGGSYSTESLLSSNHHHGSASSHHQGGGGVGGSHHQQQQQQHHHQQQQQQAQHHVQQQHQRTQHHHHQQHGHQQTQPQAQQYYQPHYLSEYGESPSGYHHNYHLPSSSGATTTTAPAQPSTPATTHHFSNYIPTSDDYHQVEGYMEEKRGGGGGRGGQQAPPYTSQLTNFNLSTIFPEMNHDLPQRGGTSVQNMNNVNSFVNLPSLNYGVEQPH